MKKQTYIFDGSISALSPLTVVIKGASTMAGHRLPRNGGMDAPAYWPATTIRGAIRHMAHRAVVEAVKEANGGAIPLDLADHFLLAQGVDIENATVSPGAGDINALEQLGLDPLLSLFGYWGVPSKACIGNAFPPAGSTGMFGGGARTIMFERNTELLELLDQEQKDRLENILVEQSEASVDIQELKNKKKELTKKAKTATKEEKEALYKEMNAIDEAIVSRKDEKTEAKESIRRPIDQYEAVAAGTEMSHRMDIKGATQVELGLFLAALAELARDPFMGGHRNHDCGRIEARWTVKTWPAGALAPIEVGSVEITPNGFIMTGDMLNSAYNAWLEARTNIRFGKPVTE